MGGARVNFTLFVVIEALFFIGLVCTRTRGWVQKFICSTRGWYKSLCVPLGEGFRSFPLINGHFWHPLLRGSGIKVYLLH